MSTLVPSLLCPCSSARAPGEAGEENFGNKGARPGWKYPGSSSRVAGIPPIPGPLGEGEETAAYNSGCRKVTGEKAAIV